jgi:hypothetical protein
LEWWRDKSIEWCYHRLENNQFGEQRYLEQFKARFSDVGEMTHAGLNLGPWNISDRNFQVVNDQILVDGVPLLLVHFHGVKLYDNGVSETGLRINVATAPQFVIEHLYKPYIQQLSRNATKATQMQFKLRLQKIGYFLLFYVLNTAGRKKTPSALLQTWYV